MRRYFNGFMVGVLVTVILLGSSSIQGSDVMTSISVILNKVNISVDGKMVGTANEDYILTDGSKVPFSISYKGTTYLPIRKVAEALGKDVYWDSTTNTAGVKPPSIQPPSSIISQTSSQTSTTTAKPNTGTNITIDGKTYLLTGATVAKLDGKFYYVMLNTGGTGFPFLLDDSGRHYVYSIGSTAFCITELLEKRYVITENTIDDNPLIAGIIKIDRKYYGEQVKITAGSTTINGQAVATRTETATYANGLKLTEKIVGNEASYEPAELFTKITTTKFYTDESSYLINLDALCNQLGLPLLDVTFNSTLSKNVISLDE